MSNDTSALRRDDIYVRNMAALFRNDARLAQRIDEIEDDGSVRVEASRRGAPTASVGVQGSDRPIQLHSKVDPEGEARRFADAVEVGKSFCYVLGGFGLGHHVRALHARLKGDAFILVTEANLQLLKAAMESVDLADVLGGDRTVILTSADKSELQERLEPHNTLMMLGTQFISHAASDRVDRDFQTGMRKLLTDHLTYCRMSLVTLVANSRMTCRNIAQNLPTYVSTPPIDFLENRFKGYPAVMIAAGPSLRKNVDQLAALKGKAVLISVQTTLKMLLERGIRPDFVTSLDYHEMSKRFFEGVEDFEGTHLVAEPKVTWHVVDTFSGPISLLDSAFARLCLGNRLGARAGLKAGATVAHLAFYLAIYMGCDPVILVGQDLGYTNHVYYTPGVAMHDFWRPELNRFWSIETKEWERLARARSILIKTRDVHGRAIYTDEQLFTYLQQFEGDFGAFPPGRIIDATEGGVRKTGTVPMSLAEATERFCTRSIPEQAFAYREQLDWNDPSRLSAGCDQIRTRLDEIARMKETCEKMLALLKEMVGLLDRPDDFNRRIADVDALRIRIREQDRTYRFVSMVSQHAELQRYRADRQLTLEDVDSKALAERQLERDSRFVEAFIEGCEALEEILQGSLERFESAIEPSSGRGVS